ncbi:MAG: DNA polymerase III subunit gamma/tau [Gammaproteobacteria bacterium]|uniref:DNA polymerase III subunit gamma/tau n=1 Tax=Limnobacter sp. TaxID=2003368 RepID=UPI001D5493F1|nr:DNA polymerase III subunit gamma/tau [Limnobacter sp.]MBU0784531.1 DNA polymerase III subunit gamma/tau [Gammaproteobacteria bacterium]MBU0847916.1 DNA polymerase III subunit gamma/tau [Gammaproteobacteria bacterium]MBU1268964.1 DNA polymerase III subunit gamma/tau [Gammaproteobacteria bacterium]MBU1529702.1 DNA polymerase III subunit gamma/tau [Gammaproteobacteria bacterium]MBU1780047.1 DNA polymerase III subunit gamma/tau [Gammaproteobacteria bacterium]
MNQTVSQALARKWRPRDFDSLVGQAHVVKALSHALDNQRLHHAYLFTGTRGVGKTTIARILARAVNCEQGIGRTPCGKCQACVEISQGRFVDLLEVDAATNTRVDEMRALLENAMYAPTAGRYKVYVIDEVHMLSTSAFNAMLKTLEEPPGHVLFILATTDPQKIPATVLSRCLQFALRQLPPDQLADHLAHILTEEKIAFEPGALRLLAKAARGSVRDALSLTDQAIAYSAGHVGEETVRTMLGAVDQQVVHQILQALAQGDGKALLELSNALATASAPFGAILDELAAIAYRLSVAHFAGGLDADDPDQAALQNLQGAFGAEDLQLIYQIATHARAELHLAPEESIGFSMALVRMLAFKPGGQGAVARSAPLAPAAVKATVPLNLPTPAAAMPAAVAAAPVVPKAAPPDEFDDSPPWDTADDAPVAQSARGDLPSAANWPQVSQEVPAKGLTRQALVQAELVDASREGDVLQIVLRTAIKAYTEPTMVTRLESVLGQYYESTVRLQMQFGEAQQTAHAVQSETRRQALEGAKQTLQEDPFLKDIQNLMGATVVSGSERTLSNTGPADI